MYKRTRTKKEKYDRPINTLNTPYLIIVESPSKCAKIEKFLGFQYRCIASQGHIRGLSKVGSSKQKYRPEYKMLSEKQEHVDKMRSIIEKFNESNIYLAMDDDREGEGIAWHICEVFDLSIEKTHRILFHEITEKAVKKAVENPMKVRMNIVYAQQARQVIDRMIGFQISPILTKLLVHDSGKFLSAGRCQTPTLGLVHDNDLQNRKKDTDTIHYNVTGAFFSHPSTMTLKLQRHLSEVECTPFLEESKSFQHALTLGKEMNKKSVAPRPFNTSHLLQTASNTLHISPKQTMAYCQLLYQEGHITYMRTDSTKYAAPFIETMKLYLDDKYGDKYIGDLTKVENTDNNNPHEAIRVTNLHVKDVSGEGRLSALYRLIWKRTMESCMSDYEYKETMLTITAPFQSNYTGTIENPQFLGWKHISWTDLDFKETQEKVSGMLMYMKTQDGQNVSPTKIECKPGVPERESHYTEAGLIQKMEKLGIGRPSTFSLLVGTIQDRKYVEKTDIEGKKKECNEYVLVEDKVTVHKKHTVFGAEKGKIVIRPLGTKAVLHLMSHFESLFSYGYTSEMETMLDKISEGNGSESFESVCKNCDETLKTCTKPLIDKMKKAYRIDDYYELIFGKTNALLQHVNEDGTKEYKSINTNIELDFVKLDAGSYKLEELIDYSEDTLGMYQNETMKIRKGPYGVYVEWGDKKESLKGLIKNDQSIEGITKEMVVKYLEKKPENKSVLRTISNNILLKTGQYGNYIQYQKGKGKKPTFINIKKSGLDCLTCPIDEIREWLKKEHRIE